MWSAHPEDCGTSSCNTHHYPICRSVTILATHSVQFTRHEYTYTPINYRVFSTCGGVGTNINYHSVVRKYSARTPRAGKLLVIGRAPYASEAHGGGGPQEGAISMT